MTSQLTVADLSPESRWQLEELWAGLERLDTEEEGLVSVREVLEASLEPVLYRLAEIEAEQESITNAWNALFKRLARAEGHAVS